MKRWVPRFGLIVLFFMIGTDVFRSSAAMDSSAQAEERVSRGAFASTNRVAGYSALSPQVENALRAKITSALEPVRLAPISWFRDVFGTVPGTGDRKRFLDSVASTGIMVCRGKDCKGCPGNERLGCVRAANAPGGGKGTLGVIHACLFGEEACPKGARPDIDGWAERFITGVIYHRLESIRGLSLAKANERSAKWIRKTSDSVNRLMKACPGPYPKQGWEFLRDVGAASDPNPAIRKCGETYLVALKRVANACRSLSLSGGKAWSDFKKTHLEGTTQIVRCDSFCRKMLCRTDASKGALTAFGQGAALSSALLLFDGACEGETPTDEGLVRDAFPSTLRRIADQGRCFPSANE